jgi:hypothetical protein
LSLNDNTCAIKFQLVISFNVTFIYSDIWSGTIHVYMFSILRTGCVYLGGPHRVYKRIAVRGVTHESVLAAENDGTTPDKHAVNLLLTLFTESELSIGNCTKPKR